MKFLVIDAGGLHVDTARCLSVNGDEVVYYNPWNSAYANFEAGAPGFGVPGITKTLSWGQHVDDADCIILPDSGMGDVGDYLRRKGKNVFSAGLGEQLEFDRAFSFKKMSQLGLKVPDTWNVKGVDQAIATLTKLLKGKGKSETNQMVAGKFYVKFDVWRGTQETFPAEDLEAATMRLNEVRSRFGAYSQTMPICIQASVEGVECGFDCFFNGEEWLTPGMWGFESGGSYIGLITRDMTIYQPDMDKLAKYFREINYRGAFSTECFYDGENLWWIDPTPRFPMPLGLMYSVFSADFPALIYGVADGSMTESNLPEGRYIGAMEISSEEALKNWSPMSGGERTRFMHYMMGQDKKAYSIPGVSCVGVACGDGKNLGEVEASCQREGEEVEVFFGNMTTSFAQDIMEKYVEPIAKLGVEFGPSPTLESRRMPKTRKTREPVGVPVRDPRGGYRMWSETTTQSAPKSRAQRLLEGG